MKTIQMRISKSTDSRERERDGEREKYPSSWPGTELTTYTAHAMTRNQTCHLLIYRTVPQTTEPHWPGLSMSILKPSMTT